MRTSLPPYTTKSPFFGGGKKTKGRSAIFSSVGRNGGCIHCALGVHGLRGSFTYYPTVPPFTNYKTIIVIGSAKTLKYISPLQLISHPSHHGPREMMIEFLNQRRREDEYQKALHSQVETLHEGEFPI